MESRTAGASTRLIAGVIALLLCAGALVLGGTAARADSAPPTAAATDPTTVSADPLPTVQVNGVVWAQTVVGTTVYAAGSFTRARPAGAPAGTQEVVRNNLLAFDIRTGQLIESFAPDLNAQALAVTPSPDGKRIYVGGDFTVANGQPRSRVAAYDTATGALVANWSPGVNSQVRALAATASTVYMGGSLTAVGSVSRTNLAAVAAANGSLLPWAPVPGIGPTDGNSLPLFDANGNAIPGTIDPVRNRQTSSEVLALVVTGGGSQVVAGGRFYTMNGARASAVAALDPVTGGNRPFAINQVVTNQGANSAVWSLSTDGTVVYGTGYDYSGPGNLEGSFAVTAAGGGIRWIADCRGDTYSSFPMNGALYTASHAHQCINIGGFPEQEPRVWKRATAVSLAANGRVGTVTQGNYNFTGRPAPALLTWFPEFAQGTYTKQYQAGWSVTGDGQYVVYGGEFPSVNGQAQQGLVRFAMPSKAPNAVGPRVEPGVGVTSVAAGVLRVSWKGASDLDNRYLTYRVYRDGAAAPVVTFTRSSQWWQVAPVAWADRAAGSGTHSYRVTVSDPYGNTTEVGSASGGSAGTGPSRPYAEAVHADGATDYWPMGESAGTTAYDQAGVDDAVASGGIGRAWAGALRGDTDSSVWFDGATGYFSTQVPRRGQNTFSVEAWFETRTTAGGKIMGFGDQRTGLSNNHDRQLWLEPNGRLHFAVWPGTPFELVTPGAYNNGVFHHAVATVGPTGMSLYVDGKLITSRTDAIMAQEITGYWRIGGDRTWSGSPFFNGRIDEVAVYPTVLTAEQVARHYTIATTGTATNVAPTAVFTSVVSDLTASVDATATTDPDGRVVSFAWDFGDGSAATGVTASRRYASPGTYTVTLRATDDKGAVGTTTRQVTVTAPPANQPPTAAFTTTPAGLTAWVDASGSRDADGTVASYAWDFGDGSTGAGATTSHTFGAAGTYPVKLTVTDDDGATGSVTRQVTVAASTGPAVVARDAFGRTTTNGLGTADIGGPWTATVGAGRQSVTPGVAQLAMPTAGNNTGAHLGDVAQTSADLRTSFTLTAAPTGGGTYVYAIGRRAGTAGDYRVRVRVAPDGSLALALSRVAGGAEAFPGGEVVVPGVTWAPGATIELRAQVWGTGTTEVRGTVWRQGTAEPAPQLVRSDTTAALQVPGAVGLAVFRPTSNTVASAARFTGFSVTTVPTGPAPNAAPTAAFTSTSDGLALSVDGSGSSDPDGTVAGFAWSFGDGTSGAGATASHTYGAAGSYPVRLTVTDDDGATAVVERTVTVTAPVVNRAPTAAFTSTSDGLALSVDGSGSSDPDGTVAGFAWSFGDGTSGAGATASHTYGAAGSYPVRLTVTDDDGATAVVERTVTVTAPVGPPPVARDSFRRTVSGGLGTADVGGPWTAANGATRQSVVPGVATLDLPAAGNLTGAYLGQVQQTSADVLASFSLTSAPTGGGASVYVTGRRVGTNQEYRARVRFLANGTVGLALTRLSGTATEVVIGSEVIVPGLTYVPGTALQVRVQVSGTGTTQLAASVWNAGDEEPAVPTITRSDTTASLQTAGGLGVAAYLSGSATRGTAVRFTAFDVAPVD
ncbi:radical SAM protein [Blastococcus sp. TF02-8]|uniref:PKD domain-containing protein n=1 Tax=Blastococcus sp. TF02-8 TaxID=2250574 RepID=UPI000DE97404|nr:PKD domain-containing protein [Blastococcus sp. TF02-8]RBY95120.1 radical SAM protein [Blastococcus sp. TF02-8]